MPTPEQIIKTVKMMREAQREYIKTKNHNFLKRSKDLEKQIDTMIREYEAGIQTSLF